MILMAALLLPGLPAYGCPIPVYRYALEFWEADPYIVEIFHKGELGPRYSELARRLDAASRGGSTGANLQVRMYDIETATDEVALGYIRRAVPGEFPWVVIRYPRVSGINKPVWSGALTGSNVDMLLDSPARSAIGSKLSQGATAVWVFLESGDRRRDRAALELLNRELRRLEQTLVLPELELWVDGYGREGQTAELPSISFEVVTLSRSDAEEQFFIDMLMGSEEDLGEFEGEPFVFPFYGRGIALWAIVGDGINEWNIREAAEFLTGPCSCQAKLLNPGVDMLMAVDWDGHVKRIADISLANPLSGMAGFTGREEEVKRMLEEATLNRIGSTSRQSAASETDPERVVYIDISGELGGVSGSQPPSPDLDTRRSADAGAREGPADTAGLTGRSTDHKTGAGAQTDIAGASGSVESTGGYRSDGGTPAGRSDDAESRAGQPSGTDSRSAAAGRQPGTTDRLSAQSPDTGPLPGADTDTGSQSRRSAATDSNGENISESVITRSPLNTILIIFAAVIGAVILAGFIIYLKNIR